MKNIWILSALLVSVSLYTSNMHANTYTLVNKTPWTNGACLKYEDKTHLFCKDDCWVELKPGEQRDFHAGACFLNSIEVNTNTRNEGKLKQIINPGISGDATWEIKENISINQTVNKPMPPTFNTTSTFINKTPWNVTVCIEYVKPTPNSNQPVNNQLASLAQCSDSCSPAIKPGKQYDFHAKICKIQSIKVTTNNRRDGIIEAAINPNYVGIGTWEIANFLDIHRTYVNTVGSQIEKGVTQAVATVAAIVPSMVSTIGDYIANSPAPKAPCYASEVALHEPRIDELPASCDPDKWNDVIKKYVPVYYLAHNELALPITAGQYFTGPGNSMKKRKKDNKGNLLVANPSSDAVVVAAGKIKMEELPDFNGGVENYFDIDKCTYYGSDPAKNKNNKGDMTFPIYVIATPSDDQAHRNEFIVQYMTFFGFNVPYPKALSALSGVDKVAGWFNQHPDLEKEANAHESDLEHFSIVFDAQTKLPKRVYYGRHGTQDGKWMDWKDVQKEEGTHPVSFAAKGGHGNYPNNGIYVRFFGFANDITNRGSRWTPQIIRVFKQDNPCYNPKTMGWIYFKGKYGAAGIDSMANHGWFATLKGEDPGMDPKQSEPFCDEHHGSGSELAENACVVSKQGSAFPES